MLLVEPAAKASVHLAHHLASAFLTVTSMTGVVCLGVNCQQLRNHSPAPQLGATRRGLSYRNLTDARVHNRLTHMKAGASHSQPKLSSAHLCCCIPHSASSP